MDNVTGRFLIVFGLPRGAPTLGVKVNRLLKEIGAEKISNSVWASDDLKTLTKIVIWIRNAGGKAAVIEERIVY
jgi:hypothetical protein